MVTPCTPGVQWIIPSKSGPRAIGPGDVKSRKSCSGVYSQHNRGRLPTGVLGKRRTVLGEAKLNSAVKGISEGIWVYSAAKELFIDDRTMILCVGASACKGTLLRTGVGKVNHLSTKQLWVQGAIQGYGVEVQNVPRAEHASDMLTHPVGEMEFQEGLHRMEYRTPDECVDHP